MVYYIVPGIFYRILNRTATKPRLSAFLSWHEHAANDSASYACILQVLDLEFDSKMMVSY